MMQDKVMIKTILPKPASALIALGFGLALAGNVSATEVALSSGVGLPGDSVEIAFTFTGDGALEGLQGEALISDPSAFSSIDASGLCSGASAVIVSCQLNGAGDRLQV